MQTNILVLIRVNTLFLTFWAKYKRERILTRQPIAQNGHCSCNIYLQLERSVITLFIIHSAQKKLFHCLLWTPGNAHQPDGGGKLNNETSVSFSINRFCFSLCLNRQVFSFVTLRRKRTRTPANCRVNSLFHHLCSQCYEAHHSYVPLLSLRRYSSPTSSPTFSVRPFSSVGRVTVDLIRGSWVRFPPRSKDLFFTSCGSLIPFTRANAQWVIHGFNQHFNLHCRVNSLFHHNMAIDILVVDTADQRKVVQQKRTRQCRKVLRVMEFLVFD